MPKKVSRRSLRDDAFDAEESVDRRGRVMGQSEVDDFLDDDLGDMDDDCDSLLDRRDMIPGLGSDLTEDPIRMYLMQMGQIPLLTREQEVSAARQIERTRDRYRHGSRQETAARPHDRSQRDQRRREESDHAADRAELPDAQGAVVAESPRFRHRHQPEDPDAPPSCGLAQPGNPPQQGRATGRRDELADRQAPTAVRTTPPSQRPDARNPAIAEREKISFAAGPAQPRRAPLRTEPPDAADAGNPSHAEPADGPDRFAPRGL